MNIRFGRISVGCVAAAAMVACAQMPQRDSGMSGKPDPQMQQVLDEMQALGAKPLDGLSVEQARANPTPADAVQQVAQKQGKSAGTSAEEDATLDGQLVGPDAEIPLRIYWPDAAAAKAVEPGATGMPVVLYIHGGGWVISDLAAYDATPRALAKAAQAIVVSADYRRAPEHRYPAAHDDTWLVYQWVLHSAPQFGGDASRVAVAGESAGGNMAAAIALRARDEKLQQPVHQLLMYPVTDAVVDSPSERENTQARPLNTAALPWFFSKYLAAGQRDERYFSIARADVKGVAPATVITAEIDPLRSEGEAYARRLQAAGVPVRERTFEGVTHEFFGMGAVVDKANEAVAFGADGLKSAWQKDGQKSAQRQ
jgi:acetyl esterase/lipase